MRGWMVTLYMLCVAAVDSSHDCVSEPSDPSCAGYQYPNASADTDMLCSMMSMMPGCSVAAHCKAKAEYCSTPEGCRRLGASGQYCQPLSILADICVESTMEDCTHYRSLCLPGNSVVQECKSQAPLPNLPSTTQANDAVKKICAMMKMEACSSCNTASSGLMTCDLLTVYSELCSTMPDMAECDTWTSMCKAIPDWHELCPRPGDGDSAPIMRMYFHTGLEDYVLFKGWVPRSVGSYLATVAAVVSMGVLFEAFVTYRVVCERRWSEESIHNKQGYQRLNSVNGDAGDAPKRFVPLSLKRAAFHTIEVTGGYLIMLIAMTFNAGLFFATLGGFFLGHLIFARYRTA